MKLARLGPLDVPRIGLGCMGMSAYYHGAGSDDAESIRTIQRALELGVTLLDTAEIYGPYVNEELLATAIQGRRDKVVLATKVGQISHRNGSYPAGNIEELRTRDSSPENIRIAVDGSLKRLRTDYLDLCYQHRLDPNIPIEDTIGALAELVSAGKIRYIGMSNATADVIRRAHAVHPIAAVQDEYSLWSRAVEAEILPTMRALGIGFVAYSPLGQGFLTGTISRPDDLRDVRRRNPRLAPGNFEQNLRIVEDIKAVAAEAGATPAQVALAWLLSQGNDIATIPGTKRVSRLEENAGADSVALSPAQLERLTAMDPPAAQAR